MSISVIALCYEQDEITLGTLKVLEEAESIILRTHRCAVGEYLRQKAIPFESLDSLYETAESFDDLDDRSAAYVIERSKQNKVCLGVFDPLTDTLVRRLKDHIAYVAPAAFTADRFAPWLRGSELRMMPADGLKAESAQGDLVIHELDSRLLAGRVKLELMDIYGPDHPVCFSQAPGMTRWIKLEDLDRQNDECYGHRCAFLLPQRELTEISRFDFLSLKHLMALLRAPGGCDWDQAQTHESLRSYLIEEAYETAAAIDEGDWEHAADELGDVLLQVVFQANIGEQYGTFTLGDITTAICSKMIRRHPHVFGSVRYTDPQEANAEWEKIKSRERQDESVSDSMMAVSRGLTSLMRAEKVLKRAQGLNQGTAREALEHLAKQSEALRNRPDTEKDIENELGDLLLACVNVLRLSGAESESCLMRAVDRFIARYKRMEMLVNKDNLSLKALTIEEMGVYWIRAVQDLHDQ